MCFIILDRVGRITSFLKVTNTTMIHNQNVLGMRVSSDSLKIKPSLCTHSFSTILQTRARHNSHTRTVRKDALDTKTKDPEDLLETNSYMLRKKINKFPNNNMHLHCAVFSCCSAQTHGEYQSSTFQLLFFHFCQCFREYTE